MKRRVDLIDLFSDLVVGADDPRRLAERTLEVVMSLSNGRSGAVFTCRESGDGVDLFASRGIDQAVLDAVPAVWETLGDSLRQGARAPTLFFVHRSAFTLRPFLPRRTFPTGPCPVLLRGV